MPKIHSLDFVLLETSMLSVNQRWTGRFMGLDVTLLLGIFNICHNITLMYMIMDGGYFDVDGVLSINYMYRKVHSYLVALTVLILQIRYLSRRHKMAYLVRELSHLCRLSTWNGEIYGCIARIVFYLGLLIVYQSLPMYKDEWKGDMDWRIILTLYFWMNFVPTAATEFTGQAMMLFQHEFKTLCDTMEDMATRRDYGMKRITALNRRHASLLAFSNAVARFTWMDTLIIIESERILVLIAIFIQANLTALIPLHWTKQLFDSAAFNYRIERITHHCFRGHRITTEANRFASMLDEIDPLDLENEEYFTELQIFRKQVTLRKLQFDCNGTLTVDMKLIFKIARDTLTLLILLIQLTDGPTIGTSISANATKADNGTEFCSAFRLFT